MTLPIPGPAIFAIVGRSLATGLKSALKLIAGILLGDLFYITIVIFGMAAIGEILGELFYVIRMIGASYIILLGLTLWFKDLKFINLAKDDEEPDRYKTLLAGFSITLGNPKAILFHLGLLPTFFNLAIINIQDAILIIFIFVAVLGSCLTIYAYVASKARRFFRDQRRMRILNRTAGTMLIGTGIIVAAEK